MSRAFKPISLAPRDGGRLAADISANEVGVANWRTKRDWRRYLEREIRREGFDWFEQNALLSLNADGPVILTFGCTAANGARALVAGTANTLYRYFSVPGSYVGPVDPFFYFDPDDQYYPYVQMTGPDTPYALDNEDVSTYFDPNDPYYPYVEDSFAGWFEIGTGFSPLGNRWQAVQVGDDIIFNNGVDLPQAYSLNETMVTPLYELRENGIAAVGTIAEFNGILLLADIAQVRENQLQTVFSLTRLNGNAHQDGSEYSGLTLATQLVGDPLVNISGGSFVFTAIMAGKTLRFRNGFQRRIDSYSSLTQVVLAPAYPVEGNIDQTFWILNAGNQDRIVIADNPVFTDNMVGLRLYWDDGNARTITTVLSATQVEVSDDFPIPSGPFSIENRLTYGRITNELLLDRIRYRVTWSDIGQARRFASTVLCSITAGSFILNLAYPIKSFHSGQEVLVLGAGVGGGNLTAIILSVVNGSRTMVLDTAAITTVTNSLVQAADMTGSIAGLFDDLDQDGTAVLRMLELNDRLVLYREQGYMIGDYDPTFDNNGTVLTAFRFSKQVRTTNALHYKHSLINVTHKGNNFHLFAGQKDIFRFDMISRLPIEFEPMQTCRSIFFNEAAKGDTVALPPGPNLAAGQVYNGDSPDGHVFLFVPEGVEHVAVKGDNEHGAFLIVDSSAVAWGSTFISYSGQINLSGGSNLPVTAQIFTPGKSISRSNFIFSGDNALTKEIFLCFPSESDDKALVFDYENGTISTTSAQYSALNTALKPNTNDKRCYVGTMDGNVLSYGLSKEVVTEWGGVSMFNRLGQPYDSILYSGLGAFGIGVDERMINAFILQLSSFSPDTVVTVSLYGRNNPNGVETLLATKVFDQLSVENLFPVFFLAYYFADKIVVSGKDNPCEISVRSYSVAGLKSESATRRKG